MFYSDFEYKFYLSPAHPRLDIPHIQTLTLEPGTWTLDTGLWRLGFGHWTVQFPDPSLQSPEIRLINALDKIRQDKARQDKKKQEMKFSGGR